MEPLRKEINDFLLVANFLNFSKAADYLGVKQSGLSKSIQKLETELGHKLFIRQARGLAITDAGKVYQENIKNINQVWSKTKSDIDELFLTVSGRFKLGIHPTIAKVILPSVLTEVLTREGVQLDVEFITSRKAAGMVLNSELDMAIVADPILYPELVVKKLWKEFIGLYSKDGQTKDIVCFNQNLVNVYKHIKLIKNEIQFQNINDYEVLSTLISSCPNIMGILPNPIAEKEGDLQLIRRFPPFFDVALVYRSDRQRTKGFDYVVNTVVKEGQKI